MVERLHVFSNFMDENDLSYAHDETGIVPNILNAILINGKQGKLICFNKHSPCQANSRNNFPNAVFINLAQHLMI